MTGQRRGRPAAGLTALGRSIDAITLDFGNTLVTFPGRFEKRGPR